MRRLVFLGLCLLLSPPTFAQVRTDARLSASPDVTLPRFKLTRTGGQVYYFVSYEKRPPMYLLVDTKGKRSTQAIASVAKIEELTEEEIAALSNKVDETGSVEPAPLARTSARISSSSRARTAAPSYRKPGFSSPRSTNVESVAPPRSTNVESVAPRIEGDGTGYTPTGIPLHTGPRGGIYHISKNGNKVYHSRKK